MNNLFVIYQKYAQSFLIKLFALVALFPQIVCAQVFGGDVKTENVLIDNEKQDYSLDEEYAEDVTDDLDENIRILPVEKRKQNDTNKPEIRLSMGNFSVSERLNGIAACSMRFYIESTMPDRISNISYRLKWPKMETPLSFDDIEPGVRLYKDYTLLGMGCYTMDKIPNIIVNRCRIKGVSQQECANAIRWVK